MYVIAKGRINILKDGKNITTLKTGMSIGEMALLDQEPRSADAICVEECVLLKINQFAFYELMASSNEIMKQIVKILSKRIRIMNKKLTANLK
jgi:CRP-like cAMP-binding protein